MVNKLFSLSSPEYLFVKDEIFRLIKFVQQNPFFDRDWIIHFASEKLVDQGYSRKLSMSLSETAYEFCQEGM